MIYLTNFNLNQNELQNAVIQPLAVAPENPKYSQIYTDSLTNKIKWYDGTAWKTIGVVVAESEINGNIVVDGVEMSVYKLEAATTEQLGGVKVGTGLQVDDGKVSIAGLDAAVAAGNYEGLQLKVNAEGKLEWFKPDTSTVDGLGQAVQTINTKLEGIEEGAQVNVIETVKVNGEALTVENKAVDITVSTKISELVNDEGFIDNTVANLANYYLKTETYSKTQVDDLISAIVTMNVLKVEALPTENISTTTIYLVPKTGGVESDIYNEFIYVEGKWELIGNTALDLTNYLQKDGDASNTTATFTSAEARELPASGEKLSVILGKVVKYLTDLKEVAFTGSYEDLSDKPKVVKREVVTLTAGQTSLEIPAVDVVSVTAKDATTGEQVCGDVKYTATGVVFEISGAYKHNIDVVVATLG